MDNTKRSRLGHTGSWGSNRRKFCQRQYATGAIAIGVPGCPELAACTPSIERVRIVLMLVVAMSCCNREIEGAVATLIRNPFAGTYQLLAESGLLGVAGCWTRPRSPPASSSLSIRPLPPGNLGTVDAMLVGVRPALDLPISEPFLGVPPDLLEARNPINGINRNREAIDFVVHRQLHGSVDVAFLFVAAHVQILIIPRISEAMNQPGISVEVENDRFVRSEQRIKVAVRETMRMVPRRLQLEKIHYIDEANLDVGELLPQQLSSGKCLLGGDVAG